MEPIILIPKELYKTCNCPGEGPDLCGFIIQKSGESVETIDAHQISSSPAKVSLVFSCQ